MFGLTEIKTEDKKADLLYFDLDFSNTEVKSFVKSIQLQKIESDFNKEKYVAEYLVNNIFDCGVKNKDGNNLFDIDMNKILISDTGITSNIISPKIQTKLHNASNFIATEGRIGLANILLINANTYLNDNMDVLFDSTKEYCKNANVKLVHSKYIPENTIYLINNTSFNSPGFKIISHTDLEGNEYYSATGFGFFSEKQALKINIIFDKQEQKEENSYNINETDLLKNISEITQNRTLPLSEYGLFVVYTIGIAGLSPQRAQEHVAQNKESNADYNNEIGKYFKFYKEIWLTDGENQTNKVDFKLI